MCGCNFRFLYCKGINLQRKNQASPLFIDFIKSNNAVVTSTVAGGVKQRLIMSGINNDIF